MSEAFAGGRLVWLASYPRSGNTFLRIIFEKIFGLATYSVYRIEGQESSDPSADALDNAPFLPPDWRHRLAAASDAPPLPVKTHDVPEDSAPAIYVVRDGRAAIDSYFHYLQKFAFEQPSLTEVIAGACQFGTWSGHYLAWQPRRRAQTLLLKYEDLVSNPAEAIATISKFLNLTPGQERLPSFDELRSQSPHFFRRGRNEDFLTRWTQAQLAFFNQLHGSVMQELGYNPGSPAESSAAVAPELATAAARLHAAYLKELHNHGLSAKQRQELASEVQTLQTEGRALREELSGQQTLLASLARSRWVRLGRALGLVRELDDPSAPPQKPEHGL